MWQAVPVAERVTNRSRSARARVPQPRAHGAAQPRAHSSAQPPARRRPSAAPDRYRPGIRRTEAEPLEASWRPEPGEPRRSSEPGHRVPGKQLGQGRKKAGLGRLVGTYGWRVYALPVLLVITVIALFDARGGAQKPTADAAASDGSPPTADAPPNPGGGPSATEIPAGPVDLKIPTAELPKGGEFTTRGDGKWHVVPGATAPVGASGGKLYKYTVDVENGIDSASFGGEDAFAQMVDATLSDPRSWTSDGKVRFQRVESRGAADFSISLTSPFTSHKPDICGFQIKYESSCYRRSEDRVVINLARWVRGAKAFNSDMTAYRQYAINHEVGHALNNGHVGCGRSGALAPVMMQQTFGVANNYVAKLNDADPTNYGAVPRDGKVCKPNAWPNPAGE